MSSILIVDDERTICEGLKNQIQKEGYGFEDIYTADSGVNALSIIETVSPEIMITDICMPQMSGIALLKQLRQTGLTTKVIVLSGYNDFEYVKAAAVLGIENYLLKPVNQEELKQTLSATLDKLDKEKKLQLVSMQNENLIRENIINRWIYGSIGETELTERADFLNLDLEASYFQPCILRILGNDENKDPILKQQLFELCSLILSQVSNCYFSRNHNGETIALFSLEPEDIEAGKVETALNLCLSESKSRLSVKPYLLLGKAVEGYWNVAASFREALGNGFYLDSVPMEQKAEPPEESGDSGASPFSYHLAEYVLAHYQEDLTLKTLAAHFKGNAAYIGQIFKRDIHQTFSEYLKTVRLEKAKDLLIRTDFSAKEIAEKTGFRNATYFCTVFKKETGLSPAEYRKKWSSP